MASYTTNLNLKKPAGNENVAIGDINNNMDAIDTAYGTLNSKVTNIIESNYDLLGKATQTGDASLTYVSGHNYRRYIIGTVSYWNTANSPQGFFGEECVEIPVSFAKRCANQYAHVRPADDSWRLYFTDTSTSTPNINVTKIGTDKTIVVFGIY